MSIFYLGTNNPAFLGRTDVPLFISRRSLSKRKKMPVAKGKWALDSGGFTELKDNGGWTINERKYVDEVRRFRDEIGNMVFAAPQDWMCEPSIVAKTRLTVRQHQIRTTDNWFTLRSLAPELPIIPVIQGWTFDDYLWHADLYRTANVDLSAIPVVGLGSVCRRQNTFMVEDLIREFFDAGIRLHAFGFKILGLKDSARYLHSSDSMAWSITARKQWIKLPDCRHMSRTCGDCLVWALQWRDKVLESISKNEAGMDQNLMFRT